ncbi:hypothetical protein [Streptomyces sp. AC512_CC834]|uniref:hypothetical protein n=1 Tax=Streptomyces sp. AC512_CC834 TaxID=2823691 RepID=UPI001C26C007|nr:hypothetical protein [Streptomyces sp. AC512_CC834]
MIRGAKRPAGRVSRWSWASSGWLVAAAVPPDETAAWLLGRGSRGWVRAAAALPAAASDE